jgi:ADP-ribosyl-[dinitrogen reductase] hydrolase
MESMTGNKDRFRGMILGTAVGDAIGLPAEGIRKARAKRMFKGDWRHRLVFGKGMVSDDTEHTIFITQCLLAHAGDSNRFVRRLAMCLRFWLLSLPAGIGMATGRAIIKLCIGFPPRKSGVFSAGNGPAMRVAPIGAFFAGNPAEIVKMVTLSTRITHTDPKALIASNAIAQMAAWIIRTGMTERPALGSFIQLLSSVSDDTAWQSLVLNIQRSYEDGLSVEAFAARLGLSNGVTGYIYHTVPVVLYAWYVHFGDYGKTLIAIWECGGDTDTTGAIAGALAGLTVGESGIPSPWIDGIWDWPRSTGKMRAMADALAAKASGEDIAAPVWYFWPSVLIRNIFFFAVVLVHGLRRLLPPY